MLLNITGGYDLGMLEVNEAADQIEKAADKDAIVIFGTSVKEEMQDEIIITVIATGFEDRPSNAGDIFSINEKKPETDASENEAQEEQAAQENEAAGAEEEESDVFGKKYTTDFEIPDFLKGIK